MQSPVHGDFMLITPYVKKGMGEDVDKGEPFWIRRADVVFVKDTVRGCIVGRRDNTPTEVAEDVDTVLWMLTSGKEADRPGTPSLRSAAS